jgi:hypothetical protein
MSSDNSSTTVQNSRGSDGQVGRQRYVAYIYTRKVENGLKVGSASLWKGSQDFPTLVGMGGEVYRDKEEIRDAVRELVNTNKVRIKFLPYPFEEW